MTDQLPFETSPDSQTWRLSRREASVAERERQATLRERELASRDAARQHAETALEVERQRVAELEGRLEAVLARVAELETALAERTATLQRTQDEAEGLRTSIGRMNRREKRRKGDAPSHARSSRSAEVDPPIALTPAQAMSAAERWLPLESSSTRRRRA